MNRERVLAQRRNLVRRSHLPTPWSVSLHRLRKRAWRSRTSAKNFPWRPRRSSLLTTLPAPASHVLLPPHPSPFNPLTPALSSDLLRLHSHTLPYPLSSSPRPSDLSSPTSHLLTRPLSSLVLRLPDSQPFPRPLLCPSTPRPLIFSSSVSPPPTQPSSPSLSRPDSSTLGDAGAGRVWRAGTDTRSPPPNPRAVRFPRPARPLTHPFRPTPTNLIQHPAAGVKRVVLACGRWDLRCWPVCAHPLPSGVPAFLGPRAQRLLGPGRAGRGSSSGA